MVATPKSEKKPGGRGGNPGPRNRKTVEEFGPVALTDKQRRFIEEFIRTGNGTRSALKVYDCKDYNSASVISTHNLKALRNPIKTYMESQDLSLRQAVQVLTEGLAATTHQKTGPGEYSKVPDFGVREKYLRHLAKWLEVPSPELEMDEAKAGIVVNVYEPSLKKGAKGRFERIEAE